MGGPGDVSSKPATTGSTLGVFQSLSKAVKGAVNDNTPLFMVKGYKFQLNGSEAKAKLKEGVTASTFKDFQIQTASSDPFAKPTSAKMAKVDVHSEGFATVENALIDDKGNIYLPSADGTGDIEVADLFIDGKAHGSEGKYYKAGTLSAPERVKVGADILACADLAKTASTTAPAESSSPKKAEVSAQKGEGLLTQAENGLKKESNNYEKAADVEKYY